MTSYIYEVDNGSGRRDRRAYCTSEEDAVETLANMNTNVSKHEPLSVRAEGTVNRLVLDSETVIEHGVPYDLVEATPVWGSRISWTGKNEYGWLDFRDEPTDEPDYQRLVELQKKYGIPEIKWSRESRRGR